ncbi:hypothetical protein HN784_03845 [bacterium]|jgi:hypothetical protein|nr:hypothetical protein [bacterium]MBT4251130.1 hypothetical protein [bacterium]MBT4598078.1 hypothetical protein [bacterium]MBT6753421.1 hypothetical protein [bacterium]MBT7038134.1 hypothetical protein [bacterium]
MHNNIKEKKSKIEIELDSFLVAVCKDKALQPFSNTFHFEGENPAQRKLGDLFGIIRSNDNSEGSAYLPNLLSQVIKREFFLKPNRGTEESFGSALNKINLALEDLAQHEITNWINNLDAVIGVISGNELHFTKLGNGQIFLSKNKKIAEISKGLNEEKNVHPVKTFSDISYGELSIGDKLIFSTKKLFDSLSWEEITRHTKTFTSSEFDNILKSTLDLEGEDVGVVITNIKEKSVTSAPKEKDLAKLNFFGESEAFTPKTSLGKRCRSLKNIEQETKNTKDKEVSITTEAPISSLIPKKTRDGEIELSKKAKKGAVNIPNKPTAPTEQKNKTVGSSPISPFEEQPELFIKEADGNKEVLEMKEIDDTNEKSFNSILNKAKKTLEDLKKNNNISASSIPLISKIKLGKSDDNIKDLSFNNSISYPIEPSKELEEQEKMEAEKETIRKEREFMRVKNGEIRKKEESTFKEKQAKSVRRTIGVYLKKVKEKLDLIDFQRILNELKSIFLKLTEKIKELYTAMHAKINSLVSGEKRIGKGNNIASESTKPTDTQIKTSFRDAMTSSITSVIAISKQKDLGRLKRKFVLLTRKYKKIILIGTISLLALIFLFSFLSKLIGNKAFNETSTTEIINDQKRGGSESETETTTIAAVNEEIKALTGDKDELFILTASGKFFRLDITNNNLKEVPLKNDMKETKTLVSMPTLRLVFLISEKRVFSYSPVTNRFTDVDIKLPNNLAIGGAGVYLQYLYILDNNSKNIYQFPRKPGGFHNYKIRIPNQQFFSAAIDLAVDDSLLVASENGEIQQYFEGKLKTSFSAKNDDYEETRIVDIETRSQPSNIYSLDSKNGVLMKILKSNQSETVKKFSEKFIDAEHFWVNEKQDRAFISTKNGDILRISL